MVTYPNGRQLLMLAKELEIVGWRALNKAAEHASGPGIRGLLQELTEARKERQQMYSNLLERVASGDTSVQAAESRSSLRQESALACGKCPCPSETIWSSDGNLSEDELLQRAMEFTWEMIAFFQRISTCVTRGADQAVVEAVIAEGFKSIRFLQARLDSCQSRYLSGSDDAARVCNLTDR